MLDRPNSRAATFRVGNSAIQVYNVHAILPTELTKNSQWGKMPRVEQRQCKVL